LSHSSTCSKTSEHTFHGPQISITWWAERGSPLFGGSGRFILKDGGDIRFELDVKAAHAARWMSTLRRCVAEPYVPESALRRCGTDYQGTEWNKPQFDAQNKALTVVAHDNLFEPWETPEKRKRMTALAVLFYRLTGMRIGYFA
jgi:hypothetical protein